MHVEYAIFNLGTPELILILLVALLLFGGKKIPELMRGLGEGVREFNAAKANIKQEIEEGIKKQPQDTATQKAEEKRA